MANLSNINNKFLVTTGGNVGIGTTSPGEKLEVAGNVGVNGFITHNGDSGTFMGWSADDTNVFYTAGNERLRIDPDGKVGIGVDPSGNTDRLQIDYPANPTSIRIGDNTTDDCYVVFNTDGNDWSIGTDRSDSNKFKISDYSRVGTNDRFVIDTSGNVGIGTSSPTNIIHISTSSNAVGRFESTDGVAYIRINDTSDSFYLVTASQKGSIGGNADVNANNLNIDLTNGNVGIGTTSPQRTLDVRGTGLNIFGTGGNTEIMLRGQVEGTGTVRNVGSWHWSVRSDVGGDNDDLKLLRFVTGTYEGIAMQVQNSTGTIIGNGIYTANNSIKIFEAQRNGGAVKSDWSYDDASTDMSLGTSTAHSFSLKTGNTRALTINNSQNVGIGTTSPSRKLHIDAGSGYPLRVDSTQQYLMEFARNGTSEWWIAVAGGFKIHENGVGDHMIIQDGGNVGIGTNQPNEKLQVAGNIHAYAPSGIDAGLFASTAAGSTTMAIRSSGITHFNGGNVGIGNTNPSVALDVTGEISASDDINTTGKLFVNKTGAELRLKSTSDTGESYINFADPSDNNVGQIFYGHSDNRMIFRVNDDERMRIDSSGKVGIGTGSPSGKLDVKGDGADIFLHSNDYKIARIQPRGTGGDYDAGLASLFNALTESVRIDSAGNSWLNGGNIGIGTTTPSQKLDVSGVARQSGANNFDNIIVKTGNTGTFTFTSSELKSQMADNVGFFIIVTVYRPTWDVSNDVGSLILNGIMPRGSASTFSTISTLKGTGISTLTATNGGTGNDLVITTDSGTTFRCSIRVMAMGGTA